MPEAPEPAWLAGVSKTEFGSAIAIAAALGAGIGKALNALWARLTASNVENHKELVQLVKDGNAANTQVAVQLALQTEIMKKGFSDMIAAMPKRSEDKVSV